MDLPSQKCWFAGFQKEVNLWKKQKAEEKKAAKKYTHNELLEALKSL